MFPFPGSGSGSGESSSQRDDSRPSSFAATDIARALSLSVSQSEEAAQIGSAGGWEAALSGDLSTTVGGGSSAGGGGDAATLETTLGTLMDKRVLAESTLDFLRSHGQLSRDAVEDTRAQGQTGLEELNAAIGRFDAARPGDA